jgi:hypothetical protein
MDTDGVEEVRKWVRDVCGLANLPEFPKDFQDGTLLCKLANALKPGAIPKVRHVRLRGGGKQQRKDNRLFRCRREPHALLSPWVRTLTCASGERGEAAVSPA